MKILDINKDNYQDILDSEENVLVKYWAPWCTYCRRIDPAFKKIAEDYSDRLVIGQLNIDEAEAIAQNNAIETIPTLIMYRNGQVVDKIVAPESKARIDRFIKDNLDK